MQLVTEKVLDISTGHLSDEDIKLLDNKEYPYTILQHEYGMMIRLVEDMILPVPNSVDFIIESDSPEEHLEKYSSGFIAILRKALHENITWINFDSDGQVYDEFKNYDW